MIHKCRLMDKLTIKCIHKNLYFLFDELFDELRHWIDYNDTCLWPVDAEHSIKCFQKSLQNKIQSFIPLSSLQYLVCVCIRTICVTSASSSSLEAVVSASGEGRHPPRLCGPRVRLRRHPDTGLRRHDRVRQIHQQPLRAPGTARPRPGVFTLGSGIENRLESGLASRFSRNR